MNEYQVNAQLRNETGKGAMRRMRRAGIVPAVIYGAGKDPENLSLKFHEILHQLENEAFYSHILTVDIEGKQTQAVLKALQRDPASDRVTHADFLRVKATEQLTMRVPLHFINEDDSAGKREGGVISHLEVDVEIVCLPRDLPEYIEVDMLEVAIGGTVLLSEIVLPEGVALTANLEDDPDADHSLVSVQMPQELEVEEEDEEAGEAGEEEAGEAGDADEAASDEDS